MSESEEAADGKDSPDGDDPASKQPNLGDSPKQAKPPDGEAAASADRDRDRDRDRGSDPDSGGLFGESAEEVTYKVTNIFNGQVEVNDGATVGFDVSEGVRRAAGRVMEAEIQALSRFYLKPPPFQQALKSLRRNHFVILVGEEGSGRSAASVMLAHTVRGTGPEQAPAPVIRFPPTRTLADLGRSKFAAGHCYVLRDWIATSAGRAALTKYDAELLAQRLAASEAYLVITELAGSRPGRATAAYEEHWTGPDPGELFDHCYTRVDRLDGVDEARDDLRDRASQLGTARRVVQLAERLCDGPEQALAAVSDSVQREVAQWFEKKPSRRAVRAATVLAFACRAGDEPADAPGVGQRGFELLFAALEEAEAEFRGDQPPEESGPPEEDEEFPQLRYRLLVQAELADFTIPAPEAAVVGVEHRPGFRTAQHRDLFMRELVRYYGDELWSPVHDWLSALVAVPSITDAHLAVSYGIGRMARYAAAEVREAYLEHWAAGQQSERYCAVFALWSMAAEEDLAPLALAQARDWVWNRGPERAMVAAIAFGGALGKSYPSEAMWWLWELAMRSRRISAYARIAMGNLLAIDADSDDPSVARYLANKVKPLFKSGTDPQQRRLALSVVADVLALPGPDHKTPAVLKVLRESPEALRPIGELWSGLLRSTPHRAAGVEILHRSLKALEKTPDGTAVAARLGRELLPPLSPAQRRQVELGLRRLNTPGDWGKGRAIIAAFLSLSTHGAHSSSATSNTTAAPETATLERNPRS